VGDMCRDYQRRRPNIACTLIQNACVRFGQESCQRPNTPTPTTRRNITQIRRPRKCLVYGFFRAHDLRPEIRVEAPRPGGRTDSESRVRVEYYQQTFDERMAVSPACKGSICIPV
jgi:hypothetical protein